MEIKLSNLLKKNLTDEVIVFETDTVYGIACQLDSVIGVERIYNIKNRNYTKPLAILCADMNQVKKLVACDDVYLESGLKHWPGALSLVLPKRNIVNDSISRGYQTVAVRIPDNDIALQILQRFGPMVVTSLNQSNEKEILNYKDALQYIDIVDYIVEGNNLKGISSTVYDPIKDIVFRQGEIKI